MSMSHCLSTYIDLFYLDSNAVNLRDGFHRFKKKPNWQSSESWRNRRMVPFSPKFSPQEFMMVQYFCFSSLSSKRMAEKITEVYHWWKLWRRHKKKTTGWGCRDHICHKQSEKKYTRFSGHSLLFWKKNTPLQMLTGSSSHIIWIWSQKDGSNIGHPPCHTQWVSRHDQSPHLWRNRHRCHSSTFPTLRHLGRKHEIQIDTAIYSMYSIAGTGHCPSCVHESYHHLSSIVLIPTWMSM